MFISILKIILLVISVSKACGATQANKQHKKEGGAREVKWRRSWYFGNIRVPLKLVLLYISACLFTLMLSAFIPHPCFQAICNIEDFHTRSEFKMIAACTITWNWIRKHGYFPLFLAFKGTFIFLTDLPSAFLSCVLFALEDQGAQWAKMIDKCVYDLLLKKLLDRRWKGRARARVVL